MVRLKKGLASKYWEELILAMIGEQFDVGNEICGAVVSTRGNEDIISVWNKTNDNQEAINKIRDQMRRILRLPVFIQLEYKKHQDSLQDKSSYRNPTMVYKPPEKRDRVDAPGLTRSATHPNNPSGTGRTDERRTFRSTSDQSNDKSKSNDYDRGGGAERGWSGGDSRKNSAGDNREGGRTGEWNKSNQSSYPTKSWGQQNNDRGSGDQQRGERTGWSSRPSTTTNDKTGGTDVKKIDIEDKWSRGLRKAPNPDEATDAGNNNQ
jgi:hypothetical protein